MSAVEDLSRRRGGREARRALRSRPIPMAEAAVRPGMEGGQYKPLTDQDMQRIHKTALKLLETVGLAQAIPSCVEAMTARGCWLNAQGRLCIPASLVEDTLASCARNFVLHARDPKHDMEPSGNRVYFGTAGAAVHIVEPETRSYRESLLVDLYDAGRIVDNCEHIHFYQRPVTARDMITGHDLDINTMYACLAGTEKHVGTSMVDPAHVDECLQILHVLAGGEDKWRERPFVSQSNCFVVPPMKFAEDACRCLEAAARGGMPVLLLSAAQAGATSPAALAGTVVQAVAECLAGLVYINCVVPGAVAIWGPWPFVSDLRTGAMSGGSGEQALITSGCAQMGHFYNLTVGSAAGMCDSKLPDMQAGYEKGVTAGISAMTGINMLYESAGMHASLLGFCLESLLIDNDMLGSINRNVRGIEVNEDTLSLDVISQVCVEGPGHYLGNEQTLALMQKDYVYPQISNRMSPKEWNEAGKPDIVERAAARKREILSTYYPEYIPRHIDEQIRAKHDIKLPRSVMEPGDPRWA
ncbi:MAG: trimethylamine methyltransferase family protein [Aestuariivirga sp.]|uniref:trimethylamine methyltransferase family protein n=1 Tax=Aestuariivirga sp. TaxID=2650926 RepID=UPI0025BAF3DF|nr:trimethylamine methyltransferase family protein [Aestuariivirga sp.]MCA3559764.1 trimethylamine methyltransferase family protein [Aestuariivirga sp.]